MSSDVVFQYSVTEDEQTPILGAVEPRMRAEAQRIEELIGKSLKLKPHQIV